MCYVIVTSRTLLWTLLTIATTLAMLAAVVSPQWMLGAPRLVNRKASQSMVMSNEGNAVQGHDHTERKSHDHWESSIPNPTNGTVFTPTVGIFNRCTRLHHFQDTFQYNCAPFVSSFSMPSDEFPGFWKAALVFFAIGLALMTFTVGASIVGCCIRAIVKKSIFTISGTIQAIAGLFFILGLILYPAGWSSKRIALLCGEESDYYMIGDCSLGWCFYLAMASTGVTFICAVLSVYADVSTSSDKVQDEIFEGKNLICLL